MQKEPPMLGEDEIRHMIQLMSPESFKQLQQIEKRGIKFNLHQLRKFLPEEHRQTGKTFLAYSKICQEFVDSPEEKMYFDIYMHDKDKIDKIDAKSNWIRGLQRFMDQYYPELNVINTTNGRTFEIHLKNGYHKEVVVNIIAPNSYTIYVPLDF